MFFCLQAHRHTDTQTHRHEGIALPVGLAVGKVYRFHRENEVGWQAAGSLMLLYATAGTHGRMSIQRVFDVDGSLM